MRTSLTLLLASIGIFVAAFAVRMTFLPHVVPIAAVEETQSLWALEAAFLLKALENIAAFGAALVIVALAARWIGSRMRLPSPTSHE
jgi:H+/gluconate symporter-like permease